MLKTPSRSQSDHLLETHLVAFVCGGAVMMLEIIGSRVIGPVFGVTLFVWAAILSVTLASLAVGYYAGGVVIDRYPQRRVLGLIVIASSLLIALGAALSTFVLLAALPLGPRLGPMLSAAVLFGPALIALGMVAPATIRLAARDPNLTGHRAGSISAVSTAGGLLATSLVVFVLIPRLATSQIQLATAAVLMLIGVLTLGRNRAAGSAAALAIVVIPSWLSEPLLPQGFAVLAQSQSAYGLVQVIEDAPRNVRFLRSDHSIIGGAYIDRPAESPFEYIDVLAAVGCLRPSAKEVLQIGLGTGALATALRARGARVDVVEIDPSVARYAGEYFGYANTSDVVLEDARTWLQSTNKVYDIIVHDTFTGGSTPEHLLSIEALGRVRALIKPGGLLALNFVGYATGDKAAASRSVATTLRTIFKHVDVYRDDTSPGITNLIFFASDLEAPVADVLNRSSDSACRDLLATHESWQEVRSIHPGVLLTDASNPLGTLSLAVSEEHFAAMNELLPIEVWLNTSVGRGP